MESNFRDTCFDQGYHGYMIGLSKENNPYTKDTLEWLYWKGAWSEAKNDEVMKRLYSGYKPTTDGLEYILSVCEQIKKPRSSYDVFLKMTEEVGELAKEVNKEVGFISGEPGVDGINGEAVDVLLCAVDILYLRGLTKDMIYEIIENKCRKWAKNP
jgi:ribosome modulation factor/NTP pyrophosphatase (non-canonical NTP hydrolase)